MMAEWPDARSEGAQRRAAREVKPPYTVETAG